MSEETARLATDSTWLRRMRQSGLMAAVADREWRTLSALLTFADTSGRCRVSLEELALVLAVERQEACNRLGDLAELHFHGEALMRLLQDPNGSSDLVTLWLSNWIWERSEAEEENDLRPVYQFAEHVFNRPLANAEILAIHQWHQQFRFSREVIIELLEECYNKGKKRLAYMNAVARSWYDDGVRGLDDLRRRREGDHEVLARHGRIINYLGLGRKLTQPEKDFLHKWTWEWGFSDEVIQRACDLTVNASRPSFAYIDKVLGGWRLRSVRTVEDAERVLAEREGLARGSRARAGQPASLAQPAGAPRPVKRGKYDHLIRG